MWLGHETYEDYERELEQFIPEVNKLIVDDNITVDNQKYFVRPILVSMKFIARIVTSTGVKYDKMAHFG